jgi:hypothetical protein
VTSFSATTFLNLLSLATTTLSLEVRWISPRRVQSSMPRGRGKPEATPTSNFACLATGIRDLRARAA